MKWQLLQTIFEHPGLSASAKVIAGRLLDHLNTRTEQCNPSYARIAGATRLSRDTAMAAVQQLEAAGILTVTRSVESGNVAQPGQRLPSNSFKFDFGTLSRSEISTNPSRKIRPLQSEISTILAEQSDHSQSENQATGSRKSRPKTKKEETGKEETGKGTDLCAEKFDRFWMQYPKRVDKPSARKAFDKAMKRASFDAIIAGVYRYAAERVDEDPKFTKHPTSWLNADAWLNESQPKPLYRGSGSRSRDTAMEGLLGDLSPEDFIRRG
jgi:hypothetical protein